jgi:hypothetical protein
MPNTPIWPEIVSMALNINIISSGVVCSGTRK